MKNNETKGEREMKTTRTNTVERVRIALTKNDMARVIVQALYNMPKLPPSDHPKVTRRAKLEKTILRDQHQAAIAAINATIRDSN